MFASAIGKLPQIEICISQIVDRSPKVKLGERQRAQDMFGALDDASNGSEPKPGTTWQWRQRRKGVKRLTVWVLGGAASIGDEDKLGWFRRMVGGDARLAEVNRVARQGTCRKVTMD